ncbi:hypothetical protein [Micromonospora sp. NPDC047074]|uniref:hypothetical protein n=1 Tax=Micromonospora sp. NPDC047074 TaxID=3154339 RepID=UPI0033D71ECE
MTRPGQKEHAIPDDAPAKPLAEYLRKLRHSLGTPSWNEIGNIANISGNTLSVLAQGKKRKDWVSYEILLKGIRGYAEEHGIGIDKEMRPYAQQIGLDPSSLPTIEQQAKAVWERLDHQGAVPDDSSATPPQDADQPAVVAIPLAVPDDSSVTTPPQDATEHSSENGSNWTIRALVAALAVIFVCLVGWAMYHWLPIGMTYKAGDQPKRGEPLTSCGSRSCPDSYWWEFNNNATTFTTVLQPVQRIPPFSPRRAILGDLVLQGVDQRCNAQIRWILRADGVELGHGILAKDNHVHETEYTSTAPIRQLELHLERTDTDPCKPVVEWRGLLAVESLPSS